MIRFFIVTILSLSVLAAGSFAQDPFAQTTDFLAVEEAYQSNVQVNDDGTATINWQIKPGYYLFQEQFKLKSDNTAFELDFSEGVLKYDDYFEKDVTVFYQQAATQSQSVVPLPATVAVTSQGCADAGLCYPPRTQYFAIDATGAVTETAADAATQNSAPSSSPTKVQEASPFLPLIILSAILGGIILNLMPCVFPVLSLKALSIANSGDKPNIIQRHGWSYTAGALVAFGVAGAIILFGRESVSSVGWGFQLQNPYFVTVMAFVFFLLGLNLLGFLEIKGSWFGAGQSLTSGSNYSASFFTGVLAAVVASPCTAPFMATALGVAITQPFAIGLIIFISLGFGMALPFLILSYSPGLARILPKPGMWMVTLKQLLAFPLLATVIWLLWVLGHQTNSDGIIYALCGLMMAGFGAWLMQFSPTSSSLKVIQQLAVLFAFLSGIYFISLTKQAEQPQNDHWQAYSKEALQTLQSQNQAVFIDLTADWCITCKVNEKTTLNSPEIVALAERLGIVMMQGDFTNHDDDIAQLLKTYNRSGVPLYLLYPSDSRKAVKVLPQILTKSIVSQAMLEIAD